MDLRITLSGVINNASLLMRTTKVFREQTRLSQKWLEFWLTLLKTDMLH